MRQSDVKCTKRVCSKLIYCSSSGDLLTKGIPMWSKFGDLVSKAGGKSTNLESSQSHNQEGDGDELIIGDDRKNENFRGHGFQLSFMHHAEPKNHDKPYFFTTQLGAPHPSYHTNPLPSFPARWTTIPNVKMPCESIIAPRIRLGPQELERIFPTKQMLRMRDAASSEGSNQPKTTTLNLSHQALGDPYQYEAFVTFMALNKHVKVLNLNDNELEDITDLELPEVVRLHLSNNNFISFDALPDLPMCEELFLTDNFLSGLSGLSESKFPRLRVLNVVRNPVHHIANYRTIVLNQIATIEEIDGVYVGQ